MVTLKAILKLTV